MVEAKFQVIFNGISDFKSKLVESLRETLISNYYEFDEERLDEFIDIQYNLEIEDKKVLVGFIFEFEKLINVDPNIIVEDYRENLSAQKSIELVLKFYDEILLDFLLSVYPRIFKLEMALREALSLIFIEKYKSDYHNLIKDTTVKPQMDKSILKNTQQKTRVFTKRMENEFFYLLFSDYTKLSQQKDLSHADLFSITERSNSYEEFKNNILDRKLSNPNSLNLISNITPIMQNLEKIRNSIAHNRSLSNNDLNNYEKYIDTINSYVNSFFTELGNQE